MAAKKTIILHGQTIEIWNRSFRVSGMSQCVCIDERYPEQSMDSLINALETFRKRASQHIRQQHKQELYGVSE